MQTLMSAICRGLVSKFETPYTCSQDDGKAEEECLGCQLFFRTENSDYDTHNGSFSNPDPAQWMY